MATEKSRPKKSKQHLSRYVNLIKTATSVSAQMRFEVMERGDFVTLVPEDPADPHCGVLGIRDFRIPRQKNMPPQNETCNASTPI